MLGATPNLAARPQALAEPGAVIIDGNTRLLLGELFDLKPAGPVSIRGFDQPVLIWRVLGEGVIDSRFEALRTTTTPFSAAMMKWICSCADGARRKRAMAASR